MQAGEPSTYARSVLRALEVAAEEEAVPGDVAIAFSGGLDSSIISCLVARRSHPNLYTVGVDGSYDIKAGKLTAELLALPWECILVSEEDIIEAVFKLVRIVPDINPLTISFEMPLYMVASRVGERHIYSGQGADELFAGYAKYLDMSEEEKERSLQDDLANLLGKGLEYERGLADHFDKELHYLYLHSKVMETVRSIPIEEEFKGSQRKAVLRDVARMLNLGEIAERKKKAAQYGSGIMKTLRRTAKKNDMTVRAFVRYLAREGEMP